MGIYNKELENALWSLAPASNKSEVRLKLTDENRQDESKAWRLITMYSILRQVSALVSMAVKTRSFTVNRANYLKDWLLEHSEEVSIYFPIIGFSYYFSKLNQKDKRIPKHSCTIPVH